MRNLLLGAVVAALLGTAAGVGVSLLRYRINAWDGWVAPQAAEFRPEGTPHVEVPETLYEFGRLDDTARGEHVFSVRNTGNVPLELTVGETSCRCTVSRIRDPIVPPGGSTTIVVSFSAEDRLGAYRQTAKITTNDHDRPEFTLSVVGEVYRSVAVLPAVIDLGRLAFDGEGAGGANILAFGPTSFEIPRFSLDDPQTATFFNVSVESIPADRLRQLDAAATGGFHVAVQTKPGLPQGEVRQTIRLQTNLEAKREIAVPVRAAVAGTLSLRGPGWSADQGVMWVGTIVRAEGAQRMTHLIARGPDRAKAHFRVKQVTPAWISATLGETEDNAADGLSQTPLEIKIPPNAPPGSYLEETGQAGEIVIETGLPASPEFRVRLSFVVPES